jgi:Rad3-related DNA helicase
VGRSKKPTAKKAIKATANEALKLLDELSDKERDKLFQIILVDSERPLHHQLKAILSEKDEQIAELEAIAEGLADHLGHTLGISRIQDILLLHWQKLSASQICRKLKTKYPELRKDNVQKIIQRQAPKWVRMSDHSAVPEDMDDVIIPECMVVTNADDIDRKIDASFRKTFG